MKINPNPDHDRHDRTTSSVPGVFLLRKMFCLKVEQYANIVGVLDFPTYEAPPANTALD